MGSGVLGTGYGVYGFRASGVWEVWGVPAPKPMLNREYQEVLLADETMIILGTTKTPASPEPETTGLCSMQERPSIPARPSRYHEATWPSRQARMEG